MVDGFLCFLRIIEIVSDFFLQAVSAPFDNQGKDGFFSGHSGLFAEKAKESFQHIPVGITSKIGGIALTEAVSRQGGAVIPVGVIVTGQCLGGFGEQEFHPFVDRVFLSRCG